MTQGFDIRASTAPDAAAINSLLARSYGQLMPAGYDAATLAPALPVMTTANPVLLASGTYFVAAAADGGVVGCGGWTAARPGDGAVEAGLGHLRHFATDPDWTGRGVGRALFERCRQTAATQGVMRWECYASLNAVDFYAGLGFRVMERIDVDFGGGVMFPSTRMRRDTG